MEVGDVVRITDCDDEPTGMGRSCNCFFCRGNSNSLGLVTEYLGSTRFNVRFDIGHWILFDTDIANNNAEVISAASR